LIGIGLLGTALATRLSHAGYAFMGFDPDAAARARLVALGGVADVPIEDIARRCSRLLFSLPGPAQVIETVDRIEPHLSPGSVILDTTTGDPEVVEAMAARIAA